MDGERQGLRRGDTNTIVDLMDHLGGRWTTDEESLPRDQESHEIDLVIDQLFDFF